MQTKQDIKTNVSHYERNSLTVTAASDLFVYEVSLRSRYTDASQVYILGAHVCTLSLYYLSCLINPDMDKK